ncbi:hypothetical protein BT69DRAFT_185393 [Atractiella rhizophila]|nr:hypothetical protein BT69DRAFT_185393 [Atractiella rhizophila]
MMQYKIVSRSSPSFFLSFLFGVALASPVCMVVVVRGGLGARAGVVACSFAARGWWKMGIWNCARAKQLPILSHSSPYPRSHPPLHIPISLPRNFAPQGGLERLEAESNPLIWLISLNTQPELELEFID